MSRQDASLRAALAYARIGWPVFPVIPQEKVPACAHGVKDATTDPEQITRWWTRNPDRNVAIATGAPGPDVLDIDRRGDGSGYPALSLLRRERLIGRERAVIATPSGGLHLYYRGSEQSNGSLRGHHVDFRSTGGYVVAPPSEVRRAADGQLRQYVVVRHQESTDQINWGAVRERLDPQPARAAWTPPRHGERRPQNLEHLVRFVAGQAEGNRDAALYWASCRALDHGQPHLLPALARAAQDAGLTQREVDRTIASARQTGRQDPHATPQAGPLGDPHLEAGR
jgi:bifunctional DNA primase/polymerase-like protein